MSHSITYQSEHFLNCKHLKCCCQGDPTTSIALLPANRCGFSWAHLVAFLKRARLLDIFIGQVPYNSRLLDQCQCQATYLLCETQFQILTMYCLFLYYQWLFKILYTLNQTSLVQMYKNHSKV